MTDFDKEDQANLDYLRQRLKRLDDDIKVPESVKASQLLLRIQHAESAPPPFIKAVPGRKHWSKLAGMAAAFVIVAGGVFYWGYFGQSSKLASPQAAPSSSAAAAAAEGAPAIAGRSVDRDEAAQYNLENGAYAEDYVQIRKRIMSAQAPPEAASFKAASSDSSAADEIAPEAAGVPDAYSAGDTEQGEAPMSSSSYKMATVSTPDALQPELVQTDGDYIYYLREPDDGAPSVAILNAESLNEVSVTPLSLSDVSGMYLTEDKIAVLYQNTAFDTVPVYRIDAGSDEMPQNLDVSAAGVAVYDISDRANPVEQLKFEQQGDLVTTQLTDGVLYLATNTRVLSNAHFEQVSDEDLIPSVRNTAVSQSLRKLPAEDICLPEQETGDSFLMLSALSLSSPENASTKAVLGGDDAYLFHDSAYVTEQRFLQESQRWETSLVKLGLAKTQINLLAQSTVEGSLNGPSSLQDTGDGVLRLTTTVTAPDGSPSGVAYALDGALEIIGATVSLLPGEEARSARWAGSIVYLESWESALYAADLSNPLAPVTLGRVAQSLPEQLSGAGNGLYVGVDSADGVAQLVVFDFSNPASPVKTASCPIDVGSGELSLLVSADGQFVAAIPVSGGVDLYRISRDKAERIGTAVGAGELTAIACDGRRLYLFTQGTVAAHSLSSLELVAKAELI